MSSSLYLIKVKKMKTMNQIAEAHDYVEKGYDKGNLVISLEPKNKSHQTGDN